MRSVLNLPLSRGAGDYFRDNERDGRATIRPNTSLPPIQHRDMSLDELIKKHDQQVAGRGKAHLALKHQTRRRPRHLESDLQIRCVRWFRLSYPHLAHVLFAVPNGGQRKLRTAQFLKAEGAVAGVADLILLTPRGGYGALCIEMKAGKGKQSDHQRAWQAEAERAGNKYVVVRSETEFIEAIDSYLVASF